MKNFFPHICFALSVCLMTACNTHQPLSVDDGDPTLQDAAATTAATTAETTLEGFVEGQNLGDALEAGAQAGAQAGVDALERGGLGARLLGIVGGAALEQLGWQGDADQADPQEADPQEADPQEADPQEDY